MTKEEQMEQAITDAEDIRVKLMNGKLPIPETMELLDLLKQINTENLERRMKNEFQRTFNRL
jgi:hypothetical protein